MQSRYFALAFGAVYLLVGIVGFIPALYTTPPATLHLSSTASYGLLFGLFPVNAWHDVLHIVVGLLGIVVFANHRASVYYARCLFVAFGLLTVMGFVPATNTFGGLMPLYGNDTWLHAASAIVASYFGWVADAPTSEPAEGSPVAAHG